MSIALLTLSELVARINAELKSLREVKEQIDVNIKNPQMHHLILDQQIERLEGLMK